MFKIFAQYILELTKFQVIYLIYFSNKYPDNRPREFKTFHMMFEVWKSG